MVDDPNGERCVSEDEPCRGAERRSRRWFADPSDPDQAAVYAARFTNYGLTSAELRTGRPIIGIAQTGSELSPCNFIHVQLAARIKDGIRDAGGVPIEFPVIPIQETTRRPTAQLDRNLAYLTLVETIAGYPFDGVVFTTGCDKTTPAALMAAATTDLPSIVMSGGPMLDSYVGGRRVGSGLVLWEGRRRVAAGEITEDELIDEIINLPPSAGHCNVMGTALSMNAVAELLGMALPGSASIPAPYSERAKTAYLTGRRIVEVVDEGLRPSSILTRTAFENAIVAVSALGGSSNSVPHLMAVAAHVGVPLELEDWDRVGHGVDLIANVQPSGTASAEEFHRAGGVAAVAHELLVAEMLHGDALTITGRSLRENYDGAVSADRDVVRPYSDPLKKEAGFVVLRSNFFDSAIMKTSVIGADFAARYLSDPAHPGEFTARAVVFEGPEDYRARIDDADLGVTPDSILVMRNSGPIGYPGAPEVVNMTPPASLVAEGVRMLPCLGDGRQSGTSDSPSILHVSPESAVGGGLSLIRTGDMIRVSIPARRVDVLVSDDELDERRRRGVAIDIVESHTPWEELYRNHVTQLGDGAHFAFAATYRGVADVWPRHSH